MKATWPFLLLAILIIWLALLIITSMASAQQVVVTCPAMPVNRISIRPDVWECAREVGTATVTLPDRVLTFKEFVIPPTLVRKVGLRRFVDACNQFGHSEQMDQLSIDLPREPVSLLGVAQPMKAAVALTLIDGTVYRGFVIYPASKSTRVGFGRRIAAEVTALGTVER